MSRLTFDDAAPDAELPDPAGRPVRLSALWFGQPLLLAFVRHFGCSECLGLVALLREAQPQLARGRLGLAVVTQGTVAATAAFARAHAPDLRLLADPQRTAYAAYGLERGNVFQLALSPPVWRGLARSRRQGRTPTLPPPGQDVRQLSGTFVIGANGRVRLPYYYEHIADHPPLDLLLRGVLGTGWEQPFEGPVGKA
jgi:peroxiredoxin